MAVPAKKIPEKKKRVRKDRAAAANGAAAEGGHDRLYQSLVRKLFADLTEGKYAIGDRLPAERELSAEFGVSRPTVREAIIALEVQGLVEVRVGSGAYVVQLPGAGEAPGFNITAFELTEARVLFEGEAASLAAVNISDEELHELSELVEQIGDADVIVSEAADRAFHLLIAQATRNGAIASTIEDFWRLRTNSPACASLHEKSRRAGVKPAIDEHRDILEALRARDSSAARAAMRAHLSAVLDHLLFATEEKAIAEARKATNSARERLTRASTA